MKPNRSHQNTALITGELKQFIRLFLPILLMTFSSCIFLMVEKLLLARLSAQSMEAAVSAAYACVLFQGPCIVLAMMCQVCVGRWQGAQDWKAIGPGVWQFIWFAFLSMLVIAPVGSLYGYYYFTGTAIEEVVMPYYTFLIFINFLYPLGAALSCFYIGQGKTRLVLISTLLSQVVKLILAYVLIFGIQDWIPALNIMGGAWSTLLAQGAFCISLSVVFLNSKHAKQYDTRQWKFRPKLFWECIQPGLLRALSRVLMASCWASIAYLMTAKGGDYLLSLSVGGTLFLFLPFLGEAICQTQTTIVSQILGSRRYFLLEKAYRSGTILVISATILVGIPLIIFPSFTFEYLFPKIIMSEAQIRQSFLGVWLSFTFFTFCYVPISYILAFKDTQYFLWMGFVNWINGYLYMYFMLKKIEIPAEDFWIYLSLMHASMALLYFLRMRILKMNVLKNPQLV